MTESRHDHCPDCGTKLPADSSVCPRCLLEIGLGETETHPPDDETLTAFATAVDGSPGDWIGPYRVLETLGEGGMGVVFLAEQKEPIRRRVALKVIKLGMDSREVVARFEAERQALAMLNHPNIAKVLDAGTTPNGRPYFVMEHVPGIAITEYCDSNRLDATNRLNLFSKVCDAVHHAHQRGLIHRDIKPSNILVAVIDGEAVPKVIDFGVAKATNQRLTEKTLFTQRGLMVGTPEYMSPEQAEMGGLDVDITTDIYSLGVLLYELLTGTLPFDATTLRQAGFAEMQRIIREEDPAKPSTKVSGLGDSATEIAQSRHTDPNSLQRMLQGDLDWIVLKALEKDRTRRYRAATELAEDITRHLTSRPVSASPPNRTYLAKKFMRRHRGLVAATATVLFVAIAGAVVTSAMFLAAEVERLERGRLATNLMVERGMEFSDNGDNLSAVPWLVKALELEDGDEHPHRLRIQSVLDHTPGLYRMWAHDGPVHHAEFSPDGSSVVSASQDGSARIWTVDATSGSAKVLLHQGPVTMAVFSPNGSQVATASEDKTARLWNASTGDPIGPPLEHLAEVVHVEFEATGDTLFTASSNGVVRAWSTNDGAMLWSYDCGPGLESVVPDKRGQYVIALGGNVALLLDSKTGILKSEITKNSRYIRNADFSQDGTRLVVGNGDGYLTEWSLGPSVEPVRDFFVSFVISKGAQVQLEIDARDNLVAAGLDGRARIWNLHTGRERPSAEIIQHDGPITSVSFAANSAWVVTTGAGGTTRVWRLNGYPVTPLLQLGSVTAAGVSPDSSLLMTAGGSGLVRLWEIASAMPSATVFEDSKYVRASQLDRSGRYLATGSGTGGRVWDLDNERPRIPTVPHDGSTWVRYSPTDDIVASFGTDRTVAVWNGATGELLFEKREYPDAVYFAEFDTTGRRLAVSWTRWQTGVVVAGSVQILDAFTGDVIVDRIGDDGEQLWAYLPDGTIATTNSDKVRIWNIDQPVRPIQEWKAHDSPIYWLVASADGSMVATYSDLGGARVWEVSSAKQVIAQVEHDDPVSAISFAPSGQLLGSATVSGEIAITDLESGNQQFLGRHQRIVNHVEFSSDDRWLMTTSSDETARVWDVETGQPVTAALRHTGGPVLIGQGRFSRDGQRFVTTAMDTYIWDMTPSHLPVQSLSDLGEAISGARIAASRSSLLDGGDLTALWSQLPREAKAELSPGIKELSIWSRVRGTVTQAYQRLDAEPYIGKLIRVGIWIRVEASDSAYARFVVRGFSHDQSFSTSSNVNDDLRIVDPHWRLYNAEVAITEESDYLTFGVQAHGKARVWVDNVAVEIVGDTTTRSIDTVLNPGFEEPAVDGRPSGWLHFGGGAHSFEVTSELPQEGESCLVMEYRVPTRLASIMENDHRTDD